MEKVKIITVIIKNVDLKKLRKKKKISLRNLRKLANVNFGHICQIEKGLIMSENVWNKLKKVLDSITV